jgi:hypothetical protein
MGKLSDLMHQKGQVHRDQGDHAQQARLEDGMPRQFAEPPDDLRDQADAEDDVVRPAKARLKP